VAQDCTVEQHEFVLSIAASIPKAIVLGDRLPAISGNTFDLSCYSVDGLTHVSDTSPSSVAKAAYSFLDFKESVVLIDKWAKDVASHASRLGGRYSVMEYMDGNFMRQHLAGDARSGCTSLPPEGESACPCGLPYSPRLASWVSAISIVDALQTLSFNPAYEQLAATAAVVRPTL
jgi:hypothetical protein